VHTAVGNMSEIAHLVLGKYGGELGNSNPGNGMTSLRRNDRSKPTTSPAARRPSESEWRSAQNRSGGPNRTSSNGADCLSAS
jgi:hypothetical protein